MKLTVTDNFRKETFAHCDQTTMKNFLFETNKPSVTIFITGGPAQTELGCRNLFTRNFYTRQIMEHSFRIFTSLEVDRQFCSLITELLRAEGLNFEVSWSNKKTFFVCDAMFSYKVPVSCLCSCPGIFFLGNISILWFVSHSYSKLLLGTFLRIF